MIKVLIFDADGVLINGDIFSKRFFKGYNIDSKDGLCSSDFVVEILKEFLI